MKSRAAPEMFLLIFCLLLVTACGGESATPVLGCAPRDGMIPDCRFQNPEDIALLPGGDSVLVSQFGTMDGSRPGSLVSYSLGEKNIKVLFPMAHEDDRSWGDAACAPPDARTFAPHGIDLEQRNDGSWMLLVVNHGSRESIEFFLVEGSGTNFTLKWRGCADGPESAYFNDVVASTNGGFWVTHMMPKDAQMSSLLRAGLFGSDSGFVYHWSAEEGFSKVPGSDGPMPNGIEKSVDERTLFINMYLGGEVRKLDLATGEVVGITEAAAPDNSTWSQDGHLLVASHTDGLSETMRCQELAEGACGFQYEIVRINPEDMSRSTLIRHSGAPLGGVTVATDLGSELMLGTFAGDRIVRVAWTALAKSNP